MPDSDSDATARLPASVEVTPGGPVEGVIRPPGSKSLTNRALICAAFANGRSELTGALQSEDTKVMIDALRSIGVQIDISDGGKTLVVNGQGAGRQAITLPANDSGKLQELYVANSGTTIRFLAAALSAAGGHYRLVGVERMHQRPIGDLVDALQMVIDGSIQAISPGGCPPVEIRCSGWKGNKLDVGGSVSSQYLSGLMMAAPLVAEADDASEAGQAKAPFNQHSTQILVSGELVSRPYVDMTAKVMRSFGAKLSLKDGGLPSDPALVVEVETGGYSPTPYEIEPDASAASYFWAAAAITSGKVTVQGLSRGAIQGDVGFCEVLEKMGCLVQYEDHCIRVEGRPLQGVDVDMNEISDTVQTLAVVALFASGPTRVRGVAHNRFKETDRIGDLARELRKLGATVEEHEDGLTIHPVERPERQMADHKVVLETYHDHRMAMSLSLAGLRISGVQIVNPACTGKTYPEFFSDLETLIGRSHQWLASESR
ncbi:3-phosphoshikimate 1-carboxyvinyltransferase [bacterium]|nr:3-phosphoshikimate 1-carboxyvinyltransferase [bacterium]